MPANEGQNKQDTGNSEVGYGRPPRARRFQKGRSGNPKGRPKGSLNVATVLAATLRERVVINEHGERKTVTKFEAAIKQLVNKAAGGDLRALQQLVALAKEAEARENNHSTENPESSEIDQEVISGIIKRCQVEEVGEQERRAGDHDDQPN